MNGAFDGKYFYVAVNEPPDHALLHVLDPKDISKNKFCEGCGSRD